MRYLFNKHNFSVERLKGKAVFLFLDYDGTLTPIVDTPYRAVLSATTRKLLRGIRDTQRCMLAIISGRALTDVEKLVNIKGIVYAGNHGLEIEGPQLKYSAVATSLYRRRLNKIKDLLERALCDMQGILIEDKGLTLSVHYRKLNRRRITSFKTIFHETLIIYIVKEQIRVRSGKMVFEIRPPVEWDKGKAVLWLLARWKFKFGNGRALPIYIGDDATDEDAFKALKGRGLTVRVGRARHSHAGYYLKNQAQVGDFLKLILAESHHG